ncbi:MAG: hypothetical protein GF317_08715 [Candidatus Lokiarchaeota archaeon]|nr:hypothetical protein [Candidatus Lokiarchaeota archaeon]MBD3199799.1 hypothetical protein [Candidatus Lokiarchaeota archaeon]
MRDPNYCSPWLFPNLESFSHLLLYLKIKSKNRLAPNNETINLDLDIITHNFEGLLFYIYNNSKLYLFDLLNIPHDCTHHRMLSLSSKYLINHGYFCFFIIPFGYFKPKNEIKFSMEIEGLELIKQLFGWSPSFLYKNVKSIIKINNSYQEIIPEFKFPIPSYHISSWFKSNHTSLIFSLINLLTTFEPMGSARFDINASDIKLLIDKTNEYLFEISEEEEDTTLSYIVNELKRLRNNVKILSKVKIINWIDDIIKYYSTNLNKVS